MLVTICEVRDEMGWTMADREGRLTARRHRPPSRIDQKTDSVSSTVSGTIEVSGVRLGVWSMKTYGVDRP